MNWRAPTAEDVNGNGDYRYLIDVMPDCVPYQAANDGDALIRISRPGWSWSITDTWRQKEKKAKADDYFFMGMAETREGAIGDMLDTLAKRRGLET